jgi:hypothetical protein
MVNFTPGRSSLREEPWYPLNRRLDGLGAVLDTEMQKMYLIIACIASVKKVV